MADILQITEDIPVDDSIYEYEYKEYNPITGAPLTLSQTTNFRLFQTERVCRRQFQIC